MHRKLDRTMAVGFGLVAAALVARSWVFDRALSHTSELSARVVHTQEVRTELAATFSLLQQAETAQRGFLLTAEAGDLTPYTLARQRLPSELDRVAWLTRDNPSQQQRLRVLRVYIAQRLDRLQQTLQVRKTQGFQAACQAMRTGAGRRLMEQVGQEVGAMDAEELRLLAQQTRASQDQDRATNHLLSVLRGLALGALAVLYAAVRRRELIERSGYERRMQAANKWLAESNEHLETLASLDALTGVKNRRAFQDQLEQELERSQRHGRALSVLMLDVDRFKQLNDAFGHLAGDQALRKVAQVLQAQARSSDVVARYGGEEFVVLLPETPSQNAVEMAERLRRAIAEHLWEQRPITISVGVASLDARTVTATQLLQEADGALYTSKKRGRNRVAVQDSRSMARTSAG